jgi:hypothetical protein
MTKAIVLHHFDENDNYWCIKSVFQLYTGAANGKYQYKIVGLGSDNQLYRYTRRGWAAL